MNIGIISAIAAAILWGLTYAIDEKILGKISPTLFLFATALTTLVVTLPSILRNKSEHLASISKLETNMALIIVFNLILSSIAGFLILHSIKNTNASLASIIEISYPFFVIFFTWILYKQTPNIALLLGGTLILAGVIIITRYA